MGREVYNAVGPSGRSGCSVVCGEHIFRPELECIAVLIHYLGAGVTKKELALKMVECDFHLDAIEKVKALSADEYIGFVQHIQQTLLNEQDRSYIGQSLLDEFKENCTCCK